jgi:hypothetical protein
MSAWFYQFGMIMAPSFDGIHQQWNPVLGTAMGGVPIFANDGFLFHPQHRIEEHQNG